MSATWCLMQVTSQTLYRLVLQLILSKEVLLVHCSREQLRPYSKIRSSTPKVLRSAVSDIGSVVSMIDRIAGSAPGNGSRVAVGEDLVAMTKCRLQAKSFMSQDGSATTKKMKRDTSAMPLNNVSSAGSFNDSFKQSYGLDNSELESTATSRVKRQKVEVRYYAVHLLMM
ncbi:hypothetical protein BHM03_00033914 [Ensete ventricosum]|nr:hypothetical protein BHM03_00033914 [Ensete ventricosum]